MTPWLIFKPVILVYFFAGGNTEKRGVTDFAPIWVNAPPLPPCHAWTSDKARSVNQTGVFETGSKGEKAST